MSEGRLADASEIERLNTEAWEIGLHQPARSRELAERALVLTRERGDANGEALALRTLGYNDLLSSDLEGSLARSSEAAAALEAGSDSAALATALNTLCIVYARLGDYEKALNHGLRCLALNREVGDRRGEAWAFTEIGNVHLATNELALANDNFESALAIFDALDYRPGSGRVQTLLGAVASRKGEPERALACFEKSLELAEQDGLSMSIVANAARLGRLHLEAGEHPRARSYMERAVAASEDIGHLELKVEAHFSLGRLEAAEGRHQEALNRLEKALSLVHGQSLVQSEAKIHEELSGLYEARGEPGRALHHHKQLHRLRGALIDEEGRTRLRNLQIRLGVEQAEKQAEIERLRFVELAGMQAELVQSEKFALLGSLVAGLSHEINTPIGVIRSNAELAGRAVEILREESTLEADNPRLRKALDALVASQKASTEAGERLDELVQSLKGYARLDEAEIQRVDISRCVIDTLSLFQAQLPSGIRLEREIVALPPATCRPGQLNQVFMTVLVNAQEAVGVEGEISVRTKRENDWARIEIQDNGKGIADDKISKIFEIDFTRKNSRVRLRMGLSNAKTIIEKHRGTIEIDSELGRGTRFVVRLPLDARVVPHFGGGWAARKG